jgi:ABC-type uncharacterized transport system fused permease/ATPase subunit
MISAALRLELPNGRVLLGTDQTALLRTIAGRWLFGKNRIGVPARARSLFSLAATLRSDRDAACRGLVPRLSERLPNATVVSIAHRPGVAQYHTRRWTLVPAGHRRATLQAA